MNPRLAEILATFFYVGRMPVAPGTLASAAGLVLAMASSRWPILYVLIMVLVTAAGFMASGPAEKASGTKDPGWIVIDEVAGMMVAFLFVPLTPAVLLSGFFLFRAFDMFKIWPANRFEDKAGAFGIMADDLMAGVYTNVVLQAALWVAVRI